LALNGTVFSIANTAVTSGTYGDGDNAAQFTVNSQGQLTAAANIAITANAANLTGTTLNGNIITSSLTTVGTLGNLSVTGNTLSGNVYANAGTVGANVVTANLLTGTLTTNAQPNITSLGTLANLAVSGTSNLGPVGNVTITGGSNGLSLTTDGVGVLSWTNQSLKYPKEVHVDPIVGNDTTGDGSYNKPYATIMKAHSVIITGVTLILHSGTYTEDVTWTRPNCDIMGVSLGGLVNATGTWIVGCPTPASIRIEDVFLSGSFTQNNTGRLYIGASILTGSFTKSAGEFTQFDQTNIDGSICSIASAGQVTFNNGIQNLVQVSNASAVVSITDSISAEVLTVTAGTVVVNNSYLYSAAATTPAVITSAGSAVYLYNSHCITPVGTLARISMAGFWTVNDTQYDRANSTLTGTNLATISHFDAVTVVGATVSATVRTTPVLFAALPSAATAGAGTRAYVTNSTTTVFAAVVAGGGANSVPVYSDGTSWRVG